MNDPFFNNWEKVKQHYHRTICTHCDEQGMAKNIGGDPIKCPAIVSVTLASSTDLMRLLAAIGGEVSA